ncbi:MAG: hypothetical protein H2049_03135 [Porphyrobacter sp.]|nr:hypothetical protein [Porphyrobacter sp.]
MNLLPFALAVLVPVMIGPLPAPASQTLTMQLCNGGTITIPIGDERPSKDRDCHPKGCHAGTCRERNQAKHPKRTI